MKLVLASLLLAGAGAGWFGLRPADSCDSVPPCSEACTVEVECIDPDTCLVTCYDEQGEVACQEEVPCDAPCDEPCESACPSPCAPAPSAAGCAPSKATAD